MRSTKKVVPYCPALDWIGSHLKNAPCLNKHVSFRIADSILTINANESYFIDTASTRLQYYLSKPAQDKNKTEITCNVTFLDPDASIELPDDWRQHQETGAAPVYLSPYKQEETKLVHFIWGRQECLYRPSDILISFNQNLQIEILLKKHAAGNVSTQYGKYPINNEILMDLVQAMYARINDLVAFHAAYLGLDDQGILIAGNSGCGKTTTSTVLLRDGFNIYSDDITLIRCGEKGSLQGTGWLMAPRFVWDTSPTLGSIEETLISKKDRRKQVLMNIQPPPSRPGESVIDREVKRVMALPEEIKKKSMGAWLEPKIIVFLEQFENGEKNHHLIPIKSQEAMINIMELVLDPTYASRRKRLFDVTYELINQCDIYNLKLGVDIGSLPELFRNIMKK